jgi:hypothetical protein
MQDAPTIKLRPLSPDHPLNDPTPTRVHAMTDAMLVLMRRLCKSADDAAKQTPSPSGLYHVGVIVDADGMIMYDEKGVPIVLPSPQIVMAIDPANHAVLLAQPNELVKRSDAAKYAAVSTSTLKRAEANGELRAFKVGERDTSYWMADINGWIMRRQRLDGAK